MSKIVMSVMLAMMVMLSWAGVAQADTTDANPKVVVVDPPRFHWGGLDLSVGVPSGAQLGAIFRPGVYWLQLEVGAAHNSMAPGIFGAITLDPMPWPIAISLTGEGGYFWRGNVPFASNPPSVGYEYFSLMPGIEFGSRRWVRFYLRGGIAWLHGDVSNISFGSNNDSSITFGNPKVDAVIPTAKMGLSIFF